LFFLNYPDRNKYRFLFHIKILQKDKIIYFYGAVAYVCDKAQILKSNSLGSNLGFPHLPAVGLGKVTQSLWASISTFVKGINRTSLACVSIT
jgi:hypothetical protein